MDLNEELKGICGRRRRFLLMRIAEIDSGQARKLCKVNKVTYDGWVRNAQSLFVQVYRRCDELSSTHKLEAIKLLRRENQLDAVILEEEMIAKMRSEIKNGDYDLIKTPLAKEVYSKLVSDLDYQPASLSLTWEQRIANIIGGEQDATNPEPEGRIIEEHSASTLLQETVQGS